ncbi:MAG: hypothetical protein GVY10_07465 [Verrucomicrobia bacterium]|jgi:hypothetical protein|nr:hypothetical protein [Verrucomicrobiota bacterium]
MNIDAYFERLRDAARRAGFTLTVYGQAGEWELPLLKREPESKGPRLYLSSGIHGDEPAGPMALLDLLRRDAFPRGAAYTIFPLLNPRALAIGTRETPEGLDLNRDYGPEPRSHEIRAHLAAMGDQVFDLTLCLHEDYDGEGFYLFAHQREEVGTDFPALALEAAAAVMPIDPRTEIDEMPAREGRVHPPPSVADPNRADLPEALRLFHHHKASVVMTTETPSGQDLDLRRRTQGAVVEKVLARFLEKGIS